MRIKFSLLYNGARQRLNFRPLHMTASTLKRRRKDGLNVSLLRLPQPISTAETGDAHRTGSAGDARQ